MQNDPTKKNYAVELEELAKLRKKRGKLVLLSLPCEDIAQPFLLTEATNADYENFIRFVDWPQGMMMK